LRRAEIAANRAQERIKRYYTTVLHAAVTGDLTRDWRKSHKPTETGSEFLKRVEKSRRAQWEQLELQRLSQAGRPPKDQKWKSRYPEPTALDSDDLASIPRGWSWATLDQIAQEGRPIIYGIIKPGPHDPNGVPYVRVTEMKDGTIDVPNLKKTSPARAAKFARATLASGDVLISKDGTIGRVAVVPPELAGGNITQHVIRAPIHDLMSREYVVSAIRSDWCQRWLTGETRGVALQGVNVADFRRLPIPIPPPSEQIEIARQVERRLSAARRLTLTLGRRLEHAKVSRQSLLGEAFNGRLLSQDPNDEPASVLLERIRATREAEAQTPKGKRMSKSKITRRPLLEVLRDHKKPMTPETLFRSSGLEAMFNESEAPQDIVDAFYEELRKLTEEPAKIIEQKDSRHHVTLKALP
jgi:type I restriction enzyme S subunit